MDLIGTRIVLKAKRQQDERQADHDDQEDRQGRRTAWTRTSMFGPPVVPPTRMCAPPCCPSIAARSPRIVCTRGGGGPGRSARTSGSPLISETPFVRGPPGVTVATFGQAW